MTKNEHLLLNSDILRVDYSRRGSTRPYMVDLAGGIRAVAKASDKSNTNKSEVAAFIVSRALGFKSVPETVWRTIPEDNKFLKAGDYSFQWFIPNSTMFEVEVEQYNKGRRPWKNWEKLVHKYNSHKNLFVFDYLIANRDRHEANLMVTNEKGINKLWWIDHGYSFEDTDYSPYSPLNTALDSLTKRSTNSVQKLVDSREKVVEELKPYLTIEEIAGVFNRASNLLRMAGAG